MNRWNDFVIQPSTDDVLRGQGLDPETVRTGKKTLLALSERAQAEGLSLLHPVAFTRELSVSEHRHEKILLGNGARLTGPLVTRHLSGADQVVAVICTIGSEVEETVARLFGEDPAYALALDGLGNAAVEMLAQQVCEHLGLQAKTAGLTVSTPLSPGSPEWPAEIGQPQIFALANAGEAGIRITSGGMMIPKKSLSFVVGIGPDMSQTGLCDLCSLKETCRYRHA
jgi:hypothetical protein